jgi:hypothetical protein
MAEKTDKRNNISLLREEVQAPVRFLLTQLQKDLDDNLLSLCVVGSALTGDFHPKYSDINTVLVVQRRSHQLLQQLAGYGKSMGKRKLRAPLLMTMEYIEQSLDVFGNSIPHPIAECFDPNSRWQNTSDAALYGSRSEA